MAYVPPDPANALRRLARQAGETYNEPMYVHLRLHTEFSVVDGTNRIDDSMAAAVAAGQPALAITDLNSLFGAIKF